MYKIFGEQLRAERKRQGLTTQMVADACGTSRSYISLIEIGRRLPGKGVLPKIATALQIKTTVVLNWYLEDISRKIQQELETPEKISR